MNPRITLVGNLASDPELRYTPNGKAVVSFSLPVSDRVQNAEGEWVDGPTSWYSVSAWNQLAHNIANTLHKGDHIIVEGKIRLRDFKRNEGKENESKGTSGEVAADFVGVSLKWATATVVRNSTGTRTA